MSEEYKKINLTGKIPSIKIGEDILFESAAICLHIADRFGNRVFSHDIGSINRAKIYQWCFFAMSELDAHTLYILLKHGGIHKNIYGESEVAVKAAKKGFETQIVKVENELKDGRDFLVNDTFSVADILIGTCLDSALNSKLGTPLEVPINCQRYWNSLKEREAFKKAYKLNYMEIS
jgi:glutathione S-transferase